MAKKTLLRSKYLTKQPSQTKKIGTILAKSILNLYLHSDKAVVLGLKGNLGAGKTTFLQGFARGLGIQENVLSPTFVILKKYALQDTKKRNKKSSKISARSEREAGRKRQSLYSRFYHIDCYRIQKPREILALGFQKIVSNPKNIITIEWAERILKILPQNTLWIQLTVINKNTRKITFLIKPIMVK